MLTEMGSPSGATCSKSISSPGMHPISNNLIDISLFSNFLMTAFCPGFNSVSFIIGLKAKYADLLLLTKYEIMLGDINKRIHFFSQSLNIPLKDRKKLKSFLGYILRVEGKSLNLINFIFCTDDELRKLNKDFLKHDYYTDILTFDLSENKKNITADIYISIDRTKENAKIFAVSFSKELHRVMIHGILHLCGYKDKKNSDIKKIRKAEDKYLTKYFK